MNKEELVESLAPRVVYCFAASSIKENEPGIHISLAGHLSVNSVFLSMDEASALYEGLRRALEIKP